MSKDNNFFEYILGALGSYTLTGFLTSDPTLSLFNSSSEGTGESISSSTNDPELSSAALTALPGVIGVGLTTLGIYGVGDSSSEKEIGKINGHRIYENCKGDIFTEAKQNDTIDDRAQKVYDKYHKNHKPIEVSGILFENDEVKKEFYRILNSYDKKELYYHLRALEEILTEAIEEENVKKLERRKNE